MAREYTCPGCGGEVEPHEDHVRALEYKDEPGFRLHLHEAAPSGIERRFHVEHFRRQLGERIFVLVHEPAAGQ